MKRLMAQDTNNFTSGYGFAVYFDDTESIQVKDNTGRTIGLESAKIPAFVKIVQTLAEADCYISFKNGAGIFLYAKEISAYE